MQRQSLTRRPRGAQVELNRQGDPNSCTPPSPALDARRLRRAFAEVTALQALPTSPLLPSLLDCFTSRDGRRAHIVTPFVPGTDLAGRLQAAGGCAPVAALACAAIAPALAATHPALSRPRRLNPHPAPRRRPLPLSHARFFAAEVLLALELVHGVGFVYRDLKVRLCAAFPRVLVPNWLQN